MLPLQVFLLGVPRIERSGEAILISRRKAIALLAYLAVNGQPYSRDSLAALLWPEYDQSGALASLRRHISLLKQSVGEENLSIQRGMVGLNPQSEVWLDTNEFRLKLASGKQHSHDSQHLCPDCLAALDEAANLYKGDFMAGFSLPDSPQFDEWQFFQSESLRRLLAEALQQLIQGYTSQGEYQRSIEYARRWLALDYLNEPAHRQLMQLYAWSGQQAAALRQYQECARLLMEELGVEPEADTVALMDAIRTRELTPPAVTGIAGPLPTVAEISLQNRYVQEDLLFVGGQGEVYRGHDRLTDDTVVIKRLRLELLNQNPELVDRFRREAEILRQLNHPNIVTILDMIEQEGKYSLVMEYVPGGSLHDLLDVQGQLPLERILNIALELADALSRAHHLQIIHRDVKPDNILLAEDGSPRLTDFGMARLAREDLRLTRTGMFIGSPAYMSPEALRGNDLDARSDIWSFGVLLYQMLAGRLPFQGNHITTVITNVLHNQPAEITQFRLDLPQMLIDLLEGMLAKEREKRIGSMRQVAAKLEAIRAGITGESIASLDGFQNTGLDLSSPATKFIGREKELREIVALLANPANRLFTLVGPGGIGKTRLAQEIAFAVKGNYSNGVYFIPLEKLDSFGHILPALAESLDFHFSEQGDPLSQLLGYLRGKQLLLIMDNFEHLLEGVQLLEEILDAAPGVKILTTSRERLNLSCEVLFPLGGLKFPEHETPGNAIEYEAARLLVQRAHMVRSSYELQPEEIPYLIQICRLVQGMPLALILAAGWLEVLSFKEIANEIAENLNILEGRFRDLPDRHLSVRAAFDYSWKRLAPAELDAFMKLSVFRGGFTRQAGQAIAGASLWTLRSLADKSFVTASKDNRFEIHTLLRQYAEEHLETSGQAERTHAAHSEYYLNALQIWEADLKGRRQVDAMDEVEKDLENIRAAWSWALHRENREAIDRAMEALSVFFHQRAREREGAELFLMAQELLAPGPGDQPDPVWGRILARSGALRSRFFLEGEELAADIEKSLAIAESYGEPADTAYSLLALGTYLENVKRDPAAGLKVHERSLNIFRSLNDRYYLANLYLLIGYGYGNTAGFDYFEKNTLRALELARATGDKALAANALGNLSAGAFCTGDYEAAERYCREALIVAGEVGYRSSVAHSTVQLGMAHLLRGDLDGGLPLVEKGLKMAQDTGTHTTIAYALAMLSLEASFRGDYTRGKALGEESFSTPSTAFGTILANWALSTAHLGLRQYDRAWYFMEEAVKEADRQRYPAMITWPLPVAAAVLSHRGQKETAAEILALAIDHSLSPARWLEKWPLVTALRTHLQAELGSSRYQTAWERGQRLKLERAIRGIMRLEQEKANFTALSDGLPKSVHPSFAQEIRFCTTSDGDRIAYAVVGAGPPLVKTANWLSHLEFDWDSPVWRHWLTNLADRHTLIRYDERGCGLSDWTVEDYSFEAWVHDLECVVDAVGLERFALLGISQGGPIAIAYAVRHPEKVSHLVLYGSYARGRLHRDLTEHQLEEAKLFIDLIKLGWGQENPVFRQVFTTLFIPEGTPEQLHWFNELQRISTSPENAAKIVAGFDVIDVQEIASKVTAPTLVLHSKGDARIPFEEGRRLAALIPGARFVPLESKNHVLLEDEPAWERFQAELHWFLSAE